MTSSSLRKRRTTGWNNAIGVLVLIGVSCGGPTAPTANVSGVWVRTYGHTDSDWLFLQQNGSQISGWFCYVGSGAPPDHATVSGTGRTFKWVLPGTPAGRIATGTIQSGDLIVASYREGSAVEFRPASFDPPRTACITSVPIALPR